MNRRALLRKIKNDCINFGFSKRLVNSLSVKDIKIFVDMVITLAMDVGTLASNVEKLSNTKG